MRLDTIVVIRALAISLVVAEHSRVAVGLHGGLNALALVSGVAMARFGFTASTPQTLTAIWRFAGRIAIPSLIIAVINQLAKAKIYLYELAFVSNWISTERVTSFPIWYPQVIVQFVLALTIIFVAFDLAPKLVAAPVRTTSVALGVAVAAALTSHATWNTVYLEDKLPQLLAWNFVFGWLLWATTIKQPPTARVRATLSATLVGCSALTYLATGTIFGTSRFGWMTSMGLVLIWFDKIVLPAVIARRIMVISQATFYIFVLHYYVFGVIRHFGMAMGYGDAYRPAIPAFALGVGVPVFIWALLTSVIRVSRRAGQASASPASVPARASV